MFWRQGYAIWGLSYEMSALVAALPIALMFVLLGVFRRPAWVASISGLVAAFALAEAGYHMPVRMAVSASLYGAAFGLFPISWVIFWAIALFRLTVESGRLDVIKRSIGQITPDPRLQALLVGFAFAGFLEGASGFGTPVAIAASLLIGLGFSPYSASAICLLANTAPVAFGSIGIPVVTLAATTGLPLDRLSVAVAALCLPLAVVLPAYLLSAVGGFGMLRGIVAPTVLCGVVFGGMQIAVATWIGPQLTDLIAAMVTMGVLVAYCRMRGETRVGARGPGRGELEAFARMGSMSESIPAGPIETDAADYGGRLNAREVATAWMPYVFLVSCILLWSWPPLGRLLAKPTVVFPWPLLHDATFRTSPIVTTEAPYHALFTLNWMAASGTACMVAVLISAATFGIGPARLGRILVGVARQLSLPTLTVCTVLAIAFLMNYSGATGTLGLALAATGRMFPFFSVLLGWLGVFLTGSDTSANALFGNLQVVTANRLGVSQVLMAAANSTGGVLGKMISLQTIAVAAGATKMKAEEQVRLFRFTLKHSLFLTAMAGLLVLVFSYRGWF